MKKTLLVALITILACLTLFTACGETEVEYSEFIITSENREQVGFTGARDEELTIPATFQDVDGTWYKVVGIDASAFKECIRLKSIIIPNTVKHIGDNAFYDCIKLETIIIPESSLIGDRAIYNTAFYNDIKNWENDSLYFNNVLMAVNTSFSGEFTIKPGTISISAYAFEDCENLTNVIIPNSVTSIGNYAFLRCSGLTSIILPENITSIGDEAFNRCTELIDITLPNNITNIGGYVFHDTKYYNTETNWNSESLYINNYLIKVKDNCSGEYIIQPGTITIAKYAFSDCSRLTSITIPNTVTSIGDSAFYYCSNLTTITIPNSVTRLGDYAFHGCSGLSSVNIPSSVTSIGKSTFFGCRKLTSITVDSKNPIYHSSENCLIETATKTIIACCNTSVIPNDNSITSIGARAFNGCNGITSVTIPNSITSIGDGAFNVCNRLTSVYYLGTAEQWSQISIDSNNESLTNATRYYYSETKPTESGNYWHYVDGVPTKWDEE